MDETRRAEEASPYPPPSQAWYLVGALMVFYIFSFIDRQVIAFLIEPMKRDMALTDTQVGVISGLGFAVLYTFLGLPIGRAADRISRKKIITVGVLVWSFMATMCEPASNSSSRVAVAAMPEAKAKPAIPPSRLATAACRASRVGLWVREYS